jgi:hypothetical protein
MPLFFFNFTSQGEISIDHIGTEFPSLEAAYLSTCQAILDIAHEKLQARQDPEKDAFEIVDARRIVLMQVPFLEVLRPRRTSNATALRDQTNRLTGVSRILLARSKALNAELCTEVERTKRLSDAINANLARASAVVSPI